MNSIKTYKLEYDFSEEENKERINELIDTILGISNDTYVPITRIVMYALDTVNDVDWELVADQDDCRTEYIENIIRKQRRI